VVSSPAGGYLAVYHSGQVCHLATSNNLMLWTHRAAVDQPTIAATPDGGLVTAAEFDDGHVARSAWRPVARARPSLSAPSSSIE
jgi:hypothetical protein